MKKSFMSKGNFRFLFLIISCMIIIPSLMSVNNGFNTNNDSSMTDDLEATQYIGYGYNVAGGRRLAENDSLQLNNPILDINNKELMSKVKIFNSSKTVYENYTTSKVSEVAEKYGQVISGGANAGATIYCVNVNVNSTFNTTKNSSWTTTQHEEYSYYTIFVKNKPVVLQMDAFEIKNYLNPTFEKEIKSIKSSSEALNALNKYGTHLPTGYTLGGMFELTNYYATNSSSYVKEGSSTFANQVSTTIGCYASAGVDFSFNEAYGSKDNNSYAVNNYKCTTYGGYTFPGLTIDQAFSYYETAFGAGYVYDIWTDSINAGKNLVIVDIPQSSEMIPIWDLLPSDESYSNARNLLIESYLSLCGNKYLEFKDIYKDVVATDLTNDRNKFDSSISSDVNYSGYDVILKDGKATKQLSVDDQLSDTISIKQGNTIILNYDTSLYKGHIVEWVSNNEDVVSVKDGRNGVLLTNKVGKAQLTLTIDGAKQTNIVKNIDVLSSASSLFSLGDGSEENPYLIFNLDDFNNMANSSADLSKNYRLMADIKDGKNSVVQQIGTTNKLFSGTFDGYGHSISITNNEHAASVLNKSNENLGLFASNSGIIKNLTIKDWTITFNKFNQSTQFIKNFGLICGSNTGTISGCKVYNCNLSFLSGVEKYTYKNINMGGIAGFNSGTIDNCEVSNCKIYNTAEDQTQAYTDSIKMVYTGGIAGLNKGGTISYCSSNKNVIRSIVSENNSSPNYLFIAAAGGIVGASIDNGKLEFCFTHSYSSKDLTFDYQQTIEARSNDDGHYGNAVAGGIAGFISYNNGDDYCVKNCLVRDIGNIKVTVGSNSSYKDRSHCGYLLGVITTNYYFKEDGKASVTDESFLKRSTLEAEGAENEYIFDSYVLMGDKNILGTEDNSSLVNDKTSYFSRVSMWSSGSVNDLSSNFTSNEQFYDSEGKAFLRIKTYDLTSEGFYANIQNVKTDFYVGDAFSVGDIKIYGTYTAGDDSYEINYYTIDNSELIFDSEGKLSTPMKATVRILVNDIVVASYGVTVKDIEVVDLYAVDSRTSNDSKFYEGDSYLDVLRKTSIKIVKANGIVEDISHKDLDDYKNAITGVLPFENMKLSSGNNDIVLHYNGLTCVYHVYAEKRDVTDIYIQNKSTLEKKTFNLGLDSLDFGEEMKIYAYYDRLPVGSSSSADRIIDDSKGYIPNTTNKAVSGVFTLKENEYELTYSRIVKGRNKIIVTYDLSVSDSFFVTGNQFVDKKTVNDFINAVDNIKESDKLEFRFKAIKKAKNILNEIGDYTCLEIIDYDETCEGILGDEGRFKKAKQDLDKAIELYNEEVRNINGKLFEAVEVSNYWPNTIFETSGVTVLSIILLILKRLLCL